MASLFVALITFVGMMLVLALAAQSLQELLKTALVIKGKTMWQAIEGLVREAIKAKGGVIVEADAVVKALLDRLRGLGQAGFRKSSIRLDALTAAQLRDLITTLQLPATPVQADIRPDTSAALAAVGERAEAWYPLAMTPVDDRYRRRMRVLAVLASAIVVIPLNAGADRIFRLARTDASFRASVDAVASRLDSAKTKASPANPQTVNAGAAAQPSADIRVASANMHAAVVTADSLLPFQVPTGKEMATPAWWVGNLASIMLVSLGAPFWHDLLETLFGWKNQVTAQAAQAQRSVGQTK